MKTTMFYCVNNKNRKSNKKIEVRLNPDFFVYAILWISKSCENHHR